MEKKNEFCLQEIKGRKAVTCIETHTEGEPEPFYRDFRKFRGIRWKKRCSI